MEIIHGRENIGKLFFRGSLASHFAHFAARGAKMRQPPHRRRKSFVALALRDMNGPGEAGEHLELQQGVCPGQSPGDLLHARATPMPPASTLNCEMSCSSFAFLVWEE